MLKSCCQLPLGAVVTVRSLAQSAPVVVAVQAHQFLFTTQATHLEPYEIGALRMALMVRLGPHRVMAAPTRLMARPGHFNAMVRRFKAQAKSSPTPARWPYQYP